MIVVEFFDFFFEVLELAAYGVTAFVLWFDATTTGVQRGLALVRGHATSAAARQVVAAEALLVPEREAGTQGPVAVAGGNRVLCVKGQVELGLRFANGWSSVVFKRVRVEVGYELAAGH